MPGRITLLHSQPLRSSAAHFVFVGRPGPVAACRRKRPHQAPAVLLTDSPRTMAMEETIEVTGLRKRFGRTVALDGMSFTVRPGQVTGFVGPNGAGKPVSGL